MEASWPPKSPKAALLSSPSGRRRYQQYQEHSSAHTSPLKQSTSKRLFGEDEDIGGEDLEGDEDEETLQLKLAAIEAKLKLKKLQQTKARSQAGLSKTKDYNKSHPLLTSAAPANVQHGNDPRNSSRQTRESATEVPVSPTNKTIPSAEERSPGRVLLGIDKGIRGKDVSLRRARGARGGASQRAGSRVDKPSSKSSTLTSIRTTMSSATTTGGHLKSFSEKMAESRSVEKKKEDRREERRRHRGTGFRLNEEEMESLRLAAEEARAHNPPRTISYREEVDFRREDILHSHEAYKATSTQLKRSNMVRTPQSPPGKPVHASDGENSNSAQENEHNTETSLFEPFSQLNLSTRILPHTFLQRSLLEEHFTLLRLPQLLRDVHAPLYELPESIIDYVVFGVIASKSCPQDHKAGSSLAKGSDDWEKKWEDGSQNQKKFMVLQLTDLTWSVDLFLFGTALPRYHRLSLGTVIAVLNPSIMPPKKGKEDTGAFSLTLHSGDDTVLEIGTAQDLGFCKAVKKDGKECGSWVNAAKTEYCDWHLNAQISKAQAGRMGVNGGSNASGLGGGGGGSGTRSRFNSVRLPGRGREKVESRGLLPRTEGQRYDSRSGSHYFVASSGGGSNSGMAGNPVYQSDRSTANLRAMDEYDPFIAEGELSRDKDSRLRKRLVAQEKERSIARNLAQMNSGGAGGEYIRHRLGVDHLSGSEQSGQKSALAMKEDIMNSDPAGNGNGKRSAESVRLSPVKKTRLLTEKGIRHPGRESFGAKDAHVGADDDDDLDII